MNSRLNSIMYKIGEADCLAKQLLRKMGRVRLEENITNDQVDSINRHLNTLEEKAKKLENIKNTLENTTFNNENGLFYYEKEVDEIISFLSAFESKN